MGQGQHKDSATSAAHTAWTPGPWHVGEGKAARIIYAPDGFAVADATVYHGNREAVEKAEANAARIVECVNYCEAGRKLRLAVEAARGDTTSLEALATRIMRTDARLRLGIDLDAVRKEGF